MPARAERNSVFNRRKDLSSDYPRASPATRHVEGLVRVSGHCRAIVTDNRGTYERDICRNLVAYVLP